MCLPIEILIESRKADMNLPIGFLPLAYIMNSFLWIKAVSICGQNDHKEEPFEAHQTQEMSDVEEDQA